MNIEPNELVMIKNDKNVIQSGFYKIKSILKKYNIPPMTSVNTNKNSKSKNSSAYDDKVSSLYDDLAVPAGLVYLQNVSKTILNNNDIVSNLNDINKNTINKNTINKNVINKNTDNKINKILKKDEVINESLYDKLFKLASISSEKNNEYDSSDENKGNKQKRQLKKKTKRVKFAKYNKTKRFYK
jgi:hypothetical protein